EGDNTPRTLRDLAVPNDTVAVEAGAPDLPCHPVAAKINAGQFLESLTAVDVTAGNGGRLGVRKIERWRQDGRRPPLAFGADGLPPFHDGPTVVAAASDPVHHFP